jgi:hypothetical protein
LGLEAHILTKPAPPVPRETIPGRRQNEWISPARAGPPSRYFPAIFSHILT